MTEKLMVHSAVLGRDVDCVVVWSDPKSTVAPHIVVRANNGRMFLAKRTLGAWTEVTLETAAARLNFMAEAAGLRRELGEAIGENKYLRQQLKKLQAAGKSDIERGQYIAVYGIDQLFPHKR